MKAYTLHRKFPGGGWEIRGIDRAKAARLIRRSARDVSTSDTYRDRTFTIAPTVEHNRREVRIRDEELAAREYNR